MHAAAHANPQAGSAVAPAETGMRVPDALGGPPHPEMLAPAPERAVTNVLVDPTDPSPAPGKGKHAKSSTCRCAAGRKNTPMARHQL